MDPVDQWFRDLARPAPRAAAASEIVTETVHRGTLRGAAIGASIHVAACESVGLAPDRPGVRLRGFTFIGEPETTEAWPDVAFDLVERRPAWCQPGNTGGRPT